MSRANDVAFGGRETVVQTLAGKEETVQIRLLPVAEFPRFMELLEDETALVDFITGKKKGWSKTLTVDSLLDIAEGATDLNFSNACRWAERRIKVTEGALPIVQKGQRINETLAGSASKSG